MTQPDMRLVPVRAGPDMLKAMVRYWQSLPGMVAFDNLSPGTFDTLIGKAMFTWEAALAAAPVREEGGAVDHPLYTVSEAARRQLVRAAGWIEKEAYDASGNDDPEDEGLDEAARFLRNTFDLSDEALGIVRNSSDEIVSAAALATREEAPAEAGERGVAGVIVDGLWPILGGSHMDAEAWTAISEVVSAALYTQQPAQASAWRPQAEAPNGCVALIRFTSGSVDIAYKTQNEPPFLQDWRRATGSDRGTQAPWPDDYVPLDYVLSLLDAPAPSQQPADDKLRLAVKAYLKALDDLEIPVMSPSLGVHRKEAVRQALAALKAEVKK